MRTFTDTDRPFCTVALPQRSLGDIQVAAEYVVAAIRTMAQRAGGEIDVVGVAAAGTAVATTSPVPAEPPLRPYATAGSG